MIRKRYPIKLKKDQELYLWTLGDVGFAGPRCDMKALMSDMQWLLKKKQAGHLVRIVGLGDWLAFPSPTERAAMVAVKGGKGFYDSTLAILDEAMLERCNNFIQFMAEFRGDFLGTVHGHHLFDFSPESDWRRLNSDQYICRQLECDYYGDIGQIRLIFAEGSFQAIVHHGYGGSRTKGTVILKRDRVFRGFTGDAVLFGHDNARMADCSNLIEWDGAVEQRSVGTGSYERAYRIGQPHNGYVETGLLNPSAIGATMLLFEIWQNKLRVRALI